MPSVLSTLQSVGRKKSKALMLRTDVLLDQLAEDGETAAAWVSAEWSGDHVGVVAEAMKQVEMIESGVSSGTPAHIIMSTVTALLEALEQVVSSHVDVAEALRAALQGSDDHGAVVTVVEHGLEVLEAVAAS